jgi:DGQHR domain-containing protein
MEESHIEFRCIQVIQPIGSFYIGAIDAADLVQISYADIRRIEGEDRAVERYLGIQRPLSKPRVKELAQYVRNVDASFPTSVILAISSTDCVYDESSHKMRVRRDAGVAKIIDGQHRIAGLEDYQNGAFQLNVTIFVDMDIEDQAMVFATINLKQTKVSKSLAYDLYEFASSRSPQKTCHNIAKLLNYRAGGPLQNRIKILGVASGKPEETLTQATFVDRLIIYISKDPGEAMKDRDLIKRGKVPERADDAIGQKLIFRNMFLDERDAEIARIIWNYFKAVENRWPEAWRTTRRGYILNRTTGFAALMRFLRPCYLELAAPGQVVSTEKFHSILTRLGLKDDDFVSDRYVPGSSGEAQLFRDLGQALDGHTQ